MIVFPVVCEAIALRRGAGSHGVNSDTVSGLYMVLDAVALMVRGCIVVVKEAPVGGVGFGVFVSSFEHAKVYTVRGWCVWERKVPRCVIWRKVRRGDRDKRSGSWVGLCWIFGIKI